MFACIVQGTTCGPHSSRRKTTPIPRVLQPSLNHSNEIQCKKSLLLHPKRGMVQQNAKMMNEVSK